MEDKEIIEKIARNSGGTNCHKYPNCEICDKLTGIVHCDFKEKAKRLYRKISEDSVVLSKEEHAKLCDLAYYGSGEEEIRKETAEKILKAIITKLIDNIAIEGDWQLEDFEYSGEEIKEVLNEIAKQFNVEIKE